MQILAFILWLSFVYAVFWAAYLVVPLLLALFRSRRIKSERRPGRCDLPRVIVVIPAHNMQREIDGCVASLHACSYPKNKLEICVVADHCSDETADYAAKAGASVLERAQEPPGKSYAIAWGLEELAKRGVESDLYVIVDATVEVDPQFLSALADTWQKGEDIVVGHASVDSSKQQWFIRCMGLTLAHRRLQNEAREKLGLSSLIEGRGMAYSHEYIARFGWSLAVPEESVGGVHPTEDWRHGVRIVANGFRVAFSGQAKIFTPLRDTLSAATKQGLRWERGRVGNAMTYGIGLLKEGLGDRSRIKIWAALDSIQPPVAILGGVCLGVAISGLGLHGQSLNAAIISLPAITVGCYAVVVVARGRREGIALWTVLWAPVYLCWRCVVFAASLARLDRRERTAKQGRV